MKSLYALLALITLSALPLLAQKQGSHFNSSKHDDGAKPEATSTAPSAHPFELVDANGKAHKLSDYKGKVVVLEWVNYDCPFVKKFYGSGKMSELQKHYREQGVVWLSINSSAKGKQGYFTGEALQKRMEAEGADPSAYLLDTSGVVGKAYGAKTTPHMVVIDQDGTVVYEGAIDSIRSTQASDIVKATNYVVQSVDALLAGQKVEYSQTKGYGCGVKY